MQIYSNSNEAGAKRLSSNSNEPARATTLCFQLARRIVTDARHEAYLMIDEDERRILGSKRFVTAVLISHR